MTAGSVLFLVCALGAVLSALGTVLTHNPIRAAMSLLAHIVTLSGLFLLLHAHLLAMLQVLVYAGAVVVLFVFVIMLIGPQAAEPAVLRGMIVKTLSAAIMVLFTAMLAFSLMPAQRDAPELAQCTVAEGAECQQFGGVGAFAQSLFMDDLVPFELISVLLTVAVVGAMAVARGRTVEETESVRRKRSEQATALAETTAREKALAAE
jgi:NADH-quinone oxidoreductase subunit J